MYNENGLFKLKKGEPMSERVVNVAVSVVGFTIGFIISRYI